MLHRFTNFWNAGKIREPFKFKWLDNKLAVVEKETDAEYIAYQYFIRNNWSLKVIKQAEGQDPKWILKKKNENGKFVTLFGKQKSYPETREKIRRSVMLEAEWIKYNLNFEFSRALCYSLFSRV